MRRGWGRSSGPRHLSPWQRMAVAALGCLLFGGLAALPLALAHSITASVVHDDAGPIPTDLSLAPGRTEVDLGIGGRLINRSLTTHGLGMDIKVTGPPSLLSTVAAGHSPHVDQVLKQYADFYSSPKAVRVGYEAALNHAIEHNAWTRELELGLPIAVVLGLIAIGSSRKLAKRQAVAVTAGALGLTLLAGYGLGALQLTDWHDANAPSGMADTFALNALDGTALSGTVADNPLLASLIDNGKTIYDREVAREASANQQFKDSASSTMDAAIDSGAISAPGQHQTMLLVTSDIHENHDMIAVVRQAVARIDAKYGPDTVAFVMDDGDNAYGEVSAKSAIDAEAKISQGAPFYSVNGNHDTDITEQQKRAAGMIILKGETKQGPDGVTLLGDDDPEVTKVNALFGLGASTSRLGNGETELEAGRKLLATAQADRPTVLAVHEAYEMAAVVGINDPSQRVYDQWYQAGASSTDGHSPDTVPNQPAALETFGHWHRTSTAKHPLHRVVANSDGTWTLVLEAGTAGGANAAQVLSNLSTPWTPPVRSAAVNLVTVDDRSHLVTKLQQLTTSPNGVFTADRPERIGSADGQPYPADKR